MPVIPESVEQAIHRAAVEALQAELDARGLLVPADRQADLAAEATQLGARLLTGLLSRCYPHEPGGADIEIEFESDRVAARLQAALAFGAATATVLAPQPPAEPVELVCAVFNLGIGLVDGLCDGDAETGGHLLGLVQDANLPEAAHQRRPRHWLRAGLPPPLGEDPTVLFTVDVIEAFFQTLHAAYPGDPWIGLRRDVGAQLGAALYAERRSVAWSSGPATVDELIGCSRLTSVLPFRILHTLAGGSHPAAGTLLGEAIWRIDDLVDLVPDARSGALNGVLLAAMGDVVHPAPAVLEHLVISTHIARAAADAAEKLSAGLQLAAGADRLGAGLFLHFIQQYAGIPAVPVG